MDSEPAPSGASGKRANLSATISGNAVGLVAVAAAASGHGRGTTAAAPSVTPTRSREHSRTNSEGSRDIATCVAGVPTQAQVLAETFAIALDDLLDCEYMMTDLPGGAKLFVFDVNRETTNYDFRVLVESTLFTVTCMPPLRVPSRERTLAGEYIARINTSCKLGLLEIDFRDGELGFRLAQKTFPGLEEHGRDVLRSLIGIALREMDDLFPFLMKVAYGGTRPEDAAREFEDLVTANCPCCRGRRAEAEQ